MIISDNLFHIWIGPKPAPLKWMGTWKDRHPKSNYWVFTDDMYKGRTWFNQHLMDHYYKMGRYNGVADLIRYELLYELGGFIPPADSICFRNTDELFCEPKQFCYTVYENEKGRPGLVSPILAANAENSFVETILDTLQQLEPGDLHQSPWRSTGNLFLKNMIEKVSPKIKIWPSYFFIPNHHDPKIPRYNGEGPVYADQLWGSTPNGRNYEDGV